MISPVFKVRGHSVGLNFEFTSNIAFSLQRLMLLLDVTFTQSLAPNFQCSQLDPHSKRRALAEQCMARTFFDNNDTTEM